MRFYPRRDTPRSSFGISPHKSASHAQAVIVRPVSSLVPLGCSLVSVFVCLHPALDQIPPLPDALVAPVLSFLRLVERVSNPFVLFTQDETQQGRLQAQMMDQNAAAPPEPAREQTLDEKVATIVGCGFTPEQARFALANTDGDVEQAVAFLVDNSS